MRIASLTRKLGLAAGALLMACAFAAHGAGADDFQAWVERFWPTAKTAGITRATYDRAFKGMTPDPKVIEAANFQPEYVKPIGEYIDRVVSDKRIELGKQKLVENKELLDQLEKRYGVDRTIIVAIWGVESNFGVQPGDMNVIRALATLVYSGTKAKYAKPQLIQALKILQRGDIWGNVPDALASTASYLKVSSWRAGETWGYEVALPKGFDPKRVSEKTVKSLGDWQKLGIVRVNGEKFPRASDRASLFAPAGADGPAFLVLNNFGAILHYNTAKSYALAVGHLSDRLKGYPAFVHAWPTDENHLALDQRIELQQLLVTKGLLVGDADGVIGPATLEAVKTYQRSKGLPVDGFPSRTILEMLRKEG